jgi:iron complex outermembrane receptor protein
MNTQQSKSRATRAGAYLTSTSGAALMAAVLMGSATVLIAGTASAQTKAAADDSVATLPEVTVTARKQSENLQVAPLAVTALNTTMLAKAHITSTNDLGRVVPSLVTHAQGEVGASSIVILRGFSDTNPTNLMGDGPIAQYLDGVYIGRDAGDTLQLVDLDRVEVEAGPQGTLFGRNATGGAISIYTAAPAKSFGGSASASYGTYNDVMTKVRLDSGELGNSGFYAKFSYMHHQRDGIVKNTLAPKSSDDPGAMSTNSYFFSLHGNLGPQVTVDYRFDWTHDRVVALAQQPILGTPDFVAVHGAAAGNPYPYPILGTPGPGGSIQIQPNRLDTVTQALTGPSVQSTGGHNLTLNFDVSPYAQIKSITAYRSLSLISNDNFGGDPTNFGNVSPFGGVLGPIPTLQTRDVHDSQYQFSQEIQLNGKAGPISYVGGLYYFDEHVGSEGFNTTATAIVPAGTCLAVVGGACVLTSTVPFATAIGSSVDNFYHGEASSRAIYLNVNYKPPILDDRLEISGGVRYTADKKDIRQYLSPARGVSPGPNSVPPSTLVTDEKTFYNFSQSVAIKFQWTPTVMTYVRGGNAYRAGGFNPQNTAIVAGHGKANAFDPETATSYEAGIKSDWLNHHLRINADAYYTDYRDLQVNLTTTCPVPGTCGFGSFTGNAGHAKFYGLEGHLTWLPARGWQVDGTVGLIDPKYEVFNLTASGIPGVDAPNVADQAHFGMPKVTASAAVEYSFPSMSIGDLSLRADWSYKSKTYMGITASAQPSIEQTAAPAFNDIGAQVTLANIPVPVQGVQFEASVYGRNLLDKHDILISTDLLQGLGFANEVWGPGREIGVMLTGKF